MVAQKSDGHVTQVPKNLIVHLLLFMVAQRVMVMFPKSKECNWLFVVAQKIGSHIPKVPKKLMFLKFTYYLW